MLDTYIPLRPKPAPRPRLSSHGAYNPTDYTEYKKALAMYCVPKIKYKTKEAVSMSVKFYYKKPKSWSKAKKESNILHVSKPDLDNLVKTVKDALNGLAYIDDAQVCDLHVTKEYADADGMSIKLTELL